MPPLLAALQPCVLGSPAFIFHTSHAFPDGAMLNMTTLCDNCSMIKRLSWNNTPFRHMLLRSSSYETFLRRASRLRGASCSFSTTPKSQISKVTELPNWEVATFRQNAFQGQVPAKFPRIDAVLPPAYFRWFTHQSEHSMTDGSDLKTAFWSEYEAMIVPLELTTMNEEGETSFVRTDAPLQMLLAHLGDSSAQRSHHGEKSYAIYLAQCELSSLPPALQQDLPTPELVRLAGKGDLYSSSIWMGRSPTYTPLHRDPNPNFFLQLAGQKAVRLFPPEIGDAIFDDVQQRLGGARYGQHASAAFRGHEMMQGPEKKLLHEVIWGNANNEHILDHASDINLNPGEALFIPKGWWHSVRGIGAGVTASVNWWFR